MAAAAYGDAMRVILTFVFGSSASAMRMGSLRERRQAYHGVGSRLPTT